MPDVNEVNKDVKDAVSYAAGSASVEGFSLTAEELKAIESAVNEKGDQSFLMAVLQYVQEKKERLNMAQENGVEVNHGKSRR